MDYTVSIGEAHSAAVSAPYRLAARKWAKDEPETRINPTSSGGGALSGGVCGLGFVRQNEGWDG